VVFFVKVFCTRCIAGKSITNDNTKNQLVACKKSISQLGWTAFTPASLIKLQTNSNTFAIQ